MTIRYIIANSRPDNKLDTGSGLPRDGGTHWSITLGAIY